MEHGLFQAADWGQIFIKRFGASRYTLDKTLRMRLRMQLIQRGQEGKALGDSIMVETELFDHREVKPHFINPCCFGEDFAAWLKQELSVLQNWDSRFQRLFRRTMAGVFGPRVARTPSGLLFPTWGWTSEAPAQWVISVTYDPGLNLVRRMFQSLIPKRSKIYEIASGKSSHPTVRSGQ